MRKTRLLALFICLALMLSLAACNSSEGTWIDDLSQQLRSLGQRQPNTGSLSVHQLVQKIADAMRHDNNLAGAFDSIPERQRDGLSLDQFQQYIRLLRRGISGSIYSFSEMSERDIKAIRAQIVEQLPEQADSLAELGGFWIHYQEIGRPEEKFAVFVRAREGQYADLFSDWVQQILDLQEISVLYFDALDRFDASALAVLLQPQDFPKDVVQIRAEKLIRFYRFNITSRTSEFKVTHARIDRIGFEAFGIINPDQTQAVSRRIEMIRLPDGNYTIDDIVPEVIHDDDLQLYFEDKWLIQFGQVEDDETVQIRSGDLESIIGPPLLHDDSVCTATASGTQRIELTYPSLKLQAEGTCFRHSRWSGLISTITLTDPACSTGTGLSPGDSEADLLRRYPFAREANYVIRGKTDSGAATLRFNMADDAIVSIELTLD